MHITPFIFFSCLLGSSLAQITTATSLTASSISTAYSCSTPISTSTSASAPIATTLNGNVSFSAINQHITVPNDIHGQPIIPPHVNITCHNCTTAGELILTAGGYHPNDSAASIAVDFFESGFLEFQARGISANISTEITLGPGFAAATFKLPLFKQQLFILPLGELGNIDFYFEIFMPIALTLNSEVDLFPGLELEIPDNSTLYLDFGHKTNSFATGFNESKLIPSFNVDADHLSFTLLTGLDFVISANTTVGSVSSSSSPSPVFDLTGTFLATLGLPTLNTTLTPLAHVNGTCDVPAPGSPDTVYDDAIGVSNSARVGLDITGGLAVNAGNFSEVWVPPAIHAFNRTLDLPSACFKFDAAETGLVAATASLPATTTTAAAATGTTGVAKATAAGGMGDGKTNNAGAGGRGPGGGASVLGMVAFVLGLVAL